MSMCSFDFKVIVLLSMSLRVYIIAGSVFECMHLGVYVISSNIYIIVVCSKVYDVCIVYVICFVLLILLHVSLLQCF